MAKKGFFRTLKAFSFAAAIFAGTLGAALCGSLFASCENMGGDVSSTALLLPMQSGGAAGSGTTAQALGKGRVTGSISQSPDVAASYAISQPTDSSASDAGISRSVLPDMSDVTITSYDVSAWGTKADGTVVPQSSPIHGTAVVAPTGADFTLELEYGNWFVRADALDSSGNILLSQTQEDVEVNADSPLVSLAFKVSYYQEAGVTGSFALPISLDPSLGIENVIYRMTSADGSVDIGGTYGVSGLSSFVLDSTKSGDFATVAPGDCDLVLEFMDASGGLLMRMDQAVQIYSNVTTKKIDGTAPYINSGVVNISADVIKKYQQSVVYVGGTGLNTGTAASDANNGTQFDPVEHIERALEIINASLLTPAEVSDGFKIFVQDNISLTQNIAPPSSKKIKIIGTNQSAPWTISGAYSDAATFSITTSGDFSCSYIVFDKINGFEVAGGQTTLNNCKITNGKEPAGKDGGGGLCVDVGGAKAVLTNCQISGCASDGFGGAIHVAADTGSGIAEVELNNCLVGEESTSCATDSLRSNYAERGGGGINVGAGGKAVIGGTKILYNASKINNGSGGGIRCLGGTLEISGGQINHNYAGFGGGGIFIMGVASVTIDDCVIGEEGADAAATGLSDCGNYSCTNFGGGIDFEAGTLSTTRGFKVLKNYASSGGGSGINGAGGGIYIGSALNLEGCQINYNFAETAGGGIYLAEAESATIDSCAVKGNASKQDGGGLMLSKNSTATISGSEISYNTAEYYGFGGGANVQGKATFTNTNISYNKSLCVNNDKFGGTGGGIYIDTTNSTTLTDKTAEIQNCKITNNQASNNATGIGGAQGGSGGGVAIISCDCSISGDDTDISANQAQYNGGGLYARENSVTFNFSGGTISGNTAAKGGAVYNRGNLLMGGSAYIPAGTDKKNDVCLATGRTVSVASSLTATPTPVATITPPSYSPGTAVLSDTGTGASAGALVQSELSKFAVVPHSGDEWTIGYNSSTKKGVLSSAVIYVSGGSDGSDDDTVATGSSAKPYKTVAHALGKVSAPNCSIIIKESATETEHLEITAAMVGLKIKSAGATAKTITGASGKEVKIYAPTTTLENIALSAWDCVDVYDDVTGVKFNNVTVSDGHNGAAGGGIWIAAGADVEAETLTVKDCYVDSNGSGGAIYVANGAKLSAKNLVIQDCHADGANANGGGVYNAGTLLLNKAQITGCAAGKKGGGIFNANNATLLLDGVCDIPSGVYLTGGATSGMTAAKPLYIKGSGFALASGADKIPLEPDIRTGTEEFQENSAVIKGWDPEDGSAAYEVTEAQVNCFVTAGTALGLEYDRTAAPPCGKLVDKSIAGGVTVNLGANILFEIGTPSASGEKARFNVIDNSSGTPIYVTPTSAQIKILQYGTPVYSADAQEVAAAYLAEGEYELYCKAVVGGVTFDTTVPFGAGGKYTPLTLEAEGASTTVTFDNKAAGDVTYRVNGGTAQTIAAGTTETITLNNAGDYVSFYGDNAKYATSETNYSHISCDKNCYVYGNIMSLVKSAGFESETALTGGFAFKSLFTSGNNIKNKDGVDIVLPATTLTEKCYYSMFDGCKKLTAAPKLPATTLQSGCYWRMFADCKSLTTAPELPATTAVQDCYCGMFNGCTSLTKAPALPATTLAYYCYGAMFKDCTSLTSAPALAATTLAECCCFKMFEGCTSLTAAPELPATTLASSCYESMFDGCTSLTSAPALPAMALDFACYRFMFRGCTSLTAAPALPATSLAGYCYFAMFGGCANLTNVPSVLPADTLLTGCYKEMFSDCTSLTAAPALPATTLATYCYESMFQGCSSLNKVTCLATDINASDCTKNWLKDVAATGTFTQAPGVAWPTGVSGIPAGWVVKGSGAVTTATPLTIEAAVDGATVTFKNKASGTVTYKLKDGTGDTIASNGSKTITLSAVGDTVQFFGDNTTYGTSGSDNSSRISCSADCYIYGNFMSLVNSTGYASANAVVANAFSYLFYNNTKIKNKSGCDLLLPATTLASSCYEGMFYGCSGLTKAPDLSATTLAEACYHKMFANCSALTASPELPAPTLVDTCYKLMFYGCSNLTSITCLATNTSATGCTTNWVYNVSSTGTFTKANGMTWPTSTDGIPGSGWTVHDAP